MEDDGERIGRVDVVDQAEASAFRRGVFGIEDEVEGGFNVGGGERAAVVEMDVGAEMENVGELGRECPRSRRGRRGEAFAHRA